MINVGTIGLGRMGRLHMMNCLQIDDVKVVAAADPSKKALRKAKSLGVSKLYTDYHDLLNHSSNIDAVVVSLPNFLHFETIQLALEAGLNVFTEKPMANTVKECREIVKSVEKSGRKFMVGHCVRFMGVVEKMKENLDKGFIGNLEVATIEEVINGPFAHPRVPAPVADWWFDPRKSGGGVLLDLGYHMIDLFRFLVGDSVVVFSCLDHKFSLPVEDSAIVILRSSDSSTKGIINVGWYQKTIFPKYNFRVILHGNAGYLSSDDLVPRNLYIHAIKEGTKNLLRRIVGKKIRPLSYTYYYESYYKELEHFFDCVKNDTDPLISVTDGLRTVELIEEAYEKSRRELVA
ncbi:MAG: Gfo/Idh/MocA family protein [Candidatus Heimdallarchaeota archaeon]